MAADEAGLRAQRESMLLRRAERAIARKNTQFIIDHQNDTLEDLTEYLKGCMQSLGHVPAREEVIGAAYLEYRFGSWTNAIRSFYSGSLKSVKSPPPFEKRKIVLECCEEEAARLEEKLRSVLNAQKINTEKER